MMGHAEAFLYDGRIGVRTVQTPGIDDFDYLLAACKRVPGGRFKRMLHYPNIWHYPLSVETFRALRREFGEGLRIHKELAAWYVEEAEKVDDQVELSAAEDAELTRVPATFARWLRGYQRVGAAWIAEGYRGAGLVGDMPGLGKTPETLAALVEAGVTGPVLVVCPKASVRGVWGYEARRHLPGVPVYLCRGNRERRERMLRRFSRPVLNDPHRLRIVVVVAEMLRVKLGNPCYTYKLKEEVDAWGEVPGEWSEDGGQFNVAAEAITIGNKISGMCKQRLKSIDGKCHLHVSDPAVIAAATGVQRTEKEIKKDLVPVDFEYPVLFDRHLFGGWSWVILDESHRLLGSLTVTKANLMGRALKLLPYRSDGRRYALSGTPFGKGGKVQGMFGTLHWLWPDEHPSYWEWVKEVFETEEVVVGYDWRQRAPKTALKILGPKGMKPDATEEEQSEAWESFMRSLGPRILRRTKGEMLKELEPKTYVEVVCELDAKQEKQLKELADYAEISTPNGPIIVNGLLALRTRSQQIANGALNQTVHGKPVFTQDSGKLDALWENLDARGIIDGAPGDKLVIASRYNEFLDAIDIMLAKDKVKRLRLDGSVGETFRNAYMERWQKGLGDERVMLVNVKAGGVSINLDAADEMHMMDEDPDPGVNEQMEDRIHRASRMHKVVIYYYRTEGTVDYMAAHSVEYRRKLQHAVMDGRRGIDDLRTMMTQALEGM